MFGLCHVLAKEPEKIVMLLREAIISVEVLFGAEFVVGHCKVVEGLAAFRGVKGWLLTCQSFEYVAYGKVSAHLIDDHFATVPSIENGVIHFRKKVT